MKNIKILVPIMILFTSFTLLFNIFKPYNSAEFNLATVYYQSYSDLRVSFFHISNNINKYLQTREIEHIIEARHSVSMAQQNIKYLKLTLETDFRNSIINEKVIKPPINPQEDMGSLYTALSKVSALLQALENDNNINYEDLVLTKEIIDDIYNALTPLDIGYNKDDKEFRIIISDEQYRNLNENINKLIEIH